MFKLLRLITQLRVINKILDVLRSIGNVVDEITDVEPLLKAMETNDYGAGAEAMRSFGTFREWLDQLTPERRALIDDNLPLIVEGLDHALPEEKILPLLEKLKAIEELLPD